MTKENKKIASYYSSPLKGKIFIAADKSISHRAIMLSAMSEGQSHISNLLESEDVMSTIEAFRSMGVKIEKKKEGNYVVEGVGLNGLKMPENSLNMGNSGTSMRLISGVLAGQEFSSHLYGDESLSKRPMMRIIEPLTKMGAEFSLENSRGFPPFSIKGVKQTKGGVFELSMASAQVKSAILLAGLYASEPTIVIEPTATRDYTETMLKARGADIKSRILDDGRVEITLIPGKALQAQNMIVPGDISSAAFPMVAATIVPDSKVTLLSVGLHPTRDGIIHSLRKMGAQIELKNQKNIAGQDIADIHISYKKLNAAYIAADCTASQIDEYPALFIAAAMAEGESHMEGLDELRIKESDRLQVMAEGLKKCGISLDYGNHWIKIRGLSGEKFNPQEEINTHLDHRIAMAFLVAGMNGDNPIFIDDASPVSTSFPQFFSLMENLGASFTKGEKNDYCH